MPASQPTQEDRDGDVDAVILGTLLLDPDAQRPWALFEIENEIGDPVAVSDSLGRLARAGLIHRLDRFVFASRAALRADQITR
jgi:hypothetical protein